MAAQEQHLSPANSRESSEEPDSRAAAGSGTGHTGSAGDDSEVRFLRACDNCRRRKVKCDGVRPACGHCKRVDTPCHYSIKPKSRRMWKCLETPEAAAAPGSSAGAAEVSQSMDETTAKLLARVETMERLLMQRTGVHSPHLSVGHGTAGSSTEDLTMYAGGGPGSSAAAMAPLLPAQQGQRLTNSLGLTGDVAARVNSATNGTGNNGGNGAATAATRETNASSRRDSEGRAGDVFFGTTIGGATHGNAGSGAGPSSSVNGDTHARAQTPGLAGLGTIAPELINDLIETLFSGSNHIMEIIHEQTFRRQYAAGTLSPLLLYSALASAARYSKNPAIRTDPPYSASAPFINRAKMLVVDALEEPSLGNAQGLLIMCMMHFSLGNEAVTTFYKALALNMCILLGYNRIDSVNGPVQPTTNCGGHHVINTASMSMGWVDREAARRLWWTIFSIENYSSVCMGLAPSIQAEYCDVSLPASTVEWTQGKPRSEVDPDAPNKRPRISETPIHQLGAYHAQLSLIFSKVASLVTHTNSSTEEAVSQFSELNTVLQRWYEGLPKELRLSSVDALLYGSQESSDYYQVCVLHMRFYTTVIQLNHAVPEFTDEPAINEPAQRKCVIAASRISDLLRSSFEIPVEVRDVNWYMCVFRAAHIHIYRLLSRDADSIARAKQDLAVHRRHLREGGPLWRLCYKLLNRLDDMEQMVMLLPAQIPVADLIKIKSLTRKGKSQLVNMQLDALIKPTLIHSEHGDSEDLPLAARVEAQGGSGRPQQQKQGSTGPDAGMASAADLYRMIDPSKSDSPMSLNSASSSGSQAHPFTPQGHALHHFVSTEGSNSMGISSPLDSQQAVCAALPFGSAAPLGILPADQLPRPLGAAKGTTALPLVSDEHPADADASVLQIANQLPPINTNIVIDTNMAETLVNYFYMVASNSSQEPPQGQQSSPMGLGQNGQSVAVAERQGGPTAALGSSQAAVGSMAAGLSSALPVLAQEHQQRGLLSGHSYDLSGLQGLANNGSKSFL